MPIVSFQYPSHSRLMESIVESKLKSMNSNSKDVKKIFKKKKFLKELLWMPLKWNSIEEVDLMKRIDQYNKQEEMEKNGKNHKYEEQVENKSNESQNDQIENEIEKDTLYNEESNSQESIDLKSNENNRIQENQKQDVQRITEEEIVDESNVETEIPKKQKTISKNEEKKSNGRKG